MRRILREAKANERQRQLSEIEANVHFKPLIDKLTEIFNQEFQRYWSEAEDSLGLKDDDPSKGESAALKNAQYDYLYRTQLRWCRTFLVSEARLQFIWRQEDSRLRKRRKSEKILIQETNEYLIQRNTLNSINDLVQDIFYMPRLVIKYGTEITRELLVSTSLMQDDYLKMRGKKISPMRQKLYQEMRLLLQEQKERGEDENLVQVARIMQKRHNWSMKQRQNFVRAFGKNRNRPRND
jgi:hypothetical protein